MIHLFILIHISKINQNNTCKREKENIKSIDIIIRYTRNLVSDGNGKYNLMMLCWGPEQKSPIHDHTNSHCIMKVLEGNLEEALFEWPQQMLKEKQNSINDNSLIDQENTSFEKVKKCFFENDWINTDEETGDEMKMKVKLKPE